MLPALYWNVRRTNFLFVRNFLKLFFSQNEEAGGRLWMGCEPHCSATLHDKASLYVLNTVASRSAIGTFGMRSPQCPFTTPLSGRCSVRSRLIEVLPHNAARRRFVRAS